MMYLLAFERGQDLGQLPPNERVIGDTVGVDLAQVSRSLGDPVLIGEPLRKG
jgi:hypothetical protein